VELPPSSWKKSKLSGPNGCVEVAFVQDRVAVRDSKDRGGPMLVFTAHEWTTFVRGVCAGEFDQPPVRQS
jgi:uncharacterized protein DUF397